MLFRCVTPWVLFCHIYALTLVPVNMKCCAETSYQVTDLPIAKLVLASDFESPIQSPMNATQSQSLGSGLYSAFSLEQRQVGQ